MVWDCQLHQARVCLECWDILTNSTCNKKMFLLTWRESNCTSRLMRWRIQREFWFADHDWTHGLLYSAAFLLLNGLRSKVLELLAAVESHFSPKPLISGSISSKRRERTRLLQNLQPTCGTSVSCGILGTYSIKRWETGLCVEFAATHCKSNCWWKTDLPWWEGSRNCVGSRDSWEESEGAEECNSIKHYGRSELHFNVPK